MFWRTQTKLKGLTPAIGASPNFVLPQKVLSDSNNSLSAKVSGKAFRSYQNRTVLGSDGLLSIWGDNGVLVNASATTLKGGTALLKLAGGRIMLRHNDNEAWTYL